MAPPRRLAGRSPQLAGEYFEIGVPPAYGLFARNVRGLSLHHLRFDVANPDLRPAVVFDHVQDAAVNGLSAWGDSRAESLLRLVESHDVLLSACRIRGRSSTFLRVEGSSSANISVDGGDLSKAAAVLSFGAGAPEAAARQRG